MSTYLLAFIVSEFEAASKSNATEPNQVGIWARKEALNQSNYAFEITKKITDVMEKYLKYPVSKMHPNLKSDHVAIPEMASGAMENWGIIMYRYFSMKIMFYDLPIMERIFSCVLNILIILEKLI